MKPDKLIFQYFRQINRVGRSVIVVRNNYDIDPKKGTLESEAEDRHDTKGVLTTINKEFWPGDTITTGKLQILISAYEFGLHIPEFIPAVGDRVIIAHETYTIDKVLSIAPAGKALAYRLLVTA